MARITQEQIKQINEVYAQCGVKAQTARIVGVSVASVTKYLIPNYGCKKDTTIKKKDVEVRGAEEFIDLLKNTSEVWERFNLCYRLSEEEWQDLKELQKEIDL